MAGAKLVRNERKSWTNWHRNVKQPIRALYDVHNPEGGATAEGYRNTVAQLQALIARASADNVRLRAIGGTWSFSRAAATDGYVLNTRWLNWMFRMSQLNISEGYAGDREGLLFAQCGTSVSELNEYLEVTQGRSLRTTGASNGQTIVGAMSTGTHGASIDQAGIQDHVVGLHIVTGPDRHLWVERASYPVVSERFIKRLDTELVSDDALFDAALVSFGSFGIISGVLLETTEPFLLKAYRKKMPFDSAIRAAMDSLQFDGLALPEPAARPYFFQVVVNPHDLDGGVYVTSMYKHPRPAGYTPEYRIKGGLGPGYDLLGPIGTLVDTIPALTPFLVNQLAKVQLKEIDGKLGTIGETFDFTTPRSKAAGAAIGIKAADTTRVIDKLIALNDDIGPMPVVFACRYVQRSKGTFAFTRHDPTCVVDIDGVFARRTLSFYRAVWEGLEAERIPFTAHWGKINQLNARRVQRMYGNDVGAWLDAREFFLDTEGLRRTFSNPFLERLGLHP